MAKFRKTSKIQLKEFLSDIFYTSSHTLSQQIVWFLCYFMITYTYPFSIYHDSIILLMILFISSWFKRLKTDPSKEILYHPFLPNAHPEKLIYACYCTTWKSLILSGISLGNTGLFFNRLFGPTPILTLNGLLENIWTICSNWHY